LNQYAPVFHGNSFAQNRVSWILPGHVFKWHLRIISALRNSKELLKPKLIRTQHAPITTSRPFSGRHPLAGNARAQPFKPQVSDVFPQVQVSPRA